MPGPGDTGEANGRPTGQGRQAIMRGNSATRRMRAALVLIGGTTLVLVAPSMASAQTDPYGGGSTVVVSPRNTDPGTTDPGTTDPSGGSVVDSPTTTDPGTTQVAADQTESSGSSLPFTGGDVAGLAAIGAGAVGIGVVASRARRRQRA
jgi:hypothetical protein